MTSGYSAVWRLLTSPSEGFEQEAEPRHADDQRATKRNRKERAEVEKIERRRNYLKHDQAQEQTANLAEAAEPIDAAEHRCEDRHEHK